MWRHMPLFLYRSLFEFAAIITMGMRHFVDASNDYLHKLFYTPCRILNRLERNISMDKDLCFFLERGGLYEKILGFGDELFIDVWMHDACFWMWRR